MAWCQKTSPLYPIHHIHSTQRGGNPQTVANCPRLHKTRPTGYIGPLGPPCTEGKIPHLSWYSEWHGARRPLHCTPSTIHSTQRGGNPQTVANCPRLHKTRPTGYIGPLGPPCTEGKIPHLSLSSARHSATATPPLCPIHHTQYTEWGHPPNCHQLSHATYIYSPARQIGPPCTEGKIPHVSWYSEWHGARRPLHCTPSTIHSTQRGGNPQTVANCPRLHKTRPTGYIGPLGPPCTEGKIPHLSLSSARHSATATPPLYPIHHTQYTEWGHPPNCHQLSHVHATYIYSPARQIGPPCTEGKIPHVSWYSEWHGARRPLHCTPSTIHSTQRGGNPQTVANCPRLHKTRPTGYIGPLGPPCTEGKIPHLSLSSARHSATATPPLCPIHHTQYTEWGHPPNCHQLSHATYIYSPARQIGPPCTEWKIPHVSWYSEWHGARRPLHSTPSTIHSTQSGGIPQTVTNCPTPHIYIALPDR